MELFTLVVNHVITGAKNYTESDVAQLAKVVHGLVHRRQGPGTTSTPCSIPAAGSPA